MVKSTVLIFPSSHDKNYQNRFCNTFDRSGNVSSQWPFITNCYERISIILFTKLVQDLALSIFPLLSVQLVTSGVDGGSRADQLPEALTNVCFMVKLWNKKFKKCIVDNLAIQLTI